MESRHPSWSYLTTLSAAGGPNYIGSGLYLTSRQSGFTPQESESAVLLRALLSSRDSSRPRFQRAVEQRRGITLAQWIWIHWYHSYARRMLDERRILFSGQPVSQRHRHED